MITEVLDAIDDLVIQEAETVGSICIAINNSYNKMLCIQESEYINNNFGIIFQEGETFDAIKEDVKKKNEGKSTANKIFFTLFRFITSVIDAIRGKLKKMPKSSKPAVEKIEKEDKKIKEDSVKKPTATKKKRVGTEKSVNKGLVCATVGTATVLVAAGAVIFGFSKTNKGKADADDTSDIDFSKEFIIEDINRPDMDKTVYTLYDLQELVNSFNGIKSTLKTIGGDISKVNSDTFKKDFENISKVFENGRPENKKIDENYIKNKGKKYVIANASSLSDNIKDSLEDVAEGLTNIKDGLEKNNTSGTEPDEKISELMKMITQLSGYTDKAAIISENIGDLIQNFAGTEISFEEINGNNSGVKQDKKTVEPDKKTESYSDIKTDSDNNEKRSLIMHLVEQLDNYPSIDENTKKTIISDIETEINNGNIKTNADIDTAVKNKVPAKSPVPPKTQPGPTNPPPGPTNPPPTQKSSTDDLIDKFDKKVKDANLEQLANDAGFDKSTLDSNIEGIKNKIKSGNLQENQFDEQIKELTKNILNNKLSHLVNDNLGQNGITQTDVQKIKDDIEKGTITTVDQVTDDFDKVLDEKKRYQIAKPLIEKLNGYKNDDEYKGYDLNFIGIEQDILNGSITTEESLKQALDDAVKNTKENLKEDFNDSRSYPEYKDIDNLDEQKVLKEIDDGKLRNRDDLEEFLTNIINGKKPDAGTSPDTETTQTSNEDSKRKLKDDCEIYIRYYSLDDSVSKELNDRIDNGEITTEDELKAAVEAKANEKQAGSETDSSTDTDNSPDNDTEPRDNQTQPTMTLEEMFAINDKLAQSGSAEFNGKNIELVNYRVYALGTDSFEYTNSDLNKHLIHITYDGVHYIIPNKNSPFSKTKLYDGGTAYTCSIGYITGDNKITFAKCTDKGFKILSQGKIE